MRVRLTFSLRNLLIFATAAVIGIMLTAALIPRASADEPSKTIKVVTDEGKELVIHRDSEIKNGGYVTINDHTSENVESAIIMMDGTAIVELKNGSTIAGKVK